MGALHSGHETLLRAAREQADHVLVTIFVNPLQFGPNEDFDRYPRTLDADLEVCRQAGVGPGLRPVGRGHVPGRQPRVRLDPGPLGAELEGASRPGFFHGVLTVVLKLLQLTRPDLAFFGEKDYQQLTLVRRMVPGPGRAGRGGRRADRPGAGRARPVQPQPLPGEPERAAALSLSAALRAGARAADDGRTRGRC